MSTPVPPRPSALLSQRSALCSDYFLQKTFICFALYSPSLVAPPAQRCVSVLRQLELITPAFGNSGVGAGQVPLGLDTDTVEWTVKTFL
eukprot:1189190-Prorocentrum_minimum.AAC.2